MPRTFAHYADAVNWCQEMRLSFLHTVTIKKVRVSLRKWKQAPIKTKRQSLDTDGMNILVLTAGHGGPDPGAVSPDGKWIEAQQAVRLRDAVAGSLRSVGVPVITDGNPGQNAPLTEALKLLRRPQLLAVEIHFNAGPDGATGVEALALIGVRMTAQKVAQATATALGLPLRGDGGWKPDDAGQHHRLAYCRSGGIILEVAFISNPNDLDAYQTHFSDLVEALTKTLQSLC